MSSRFWYLAGPASFLDKAVSGALSTPCGLFGIVLPDRRPYGFVDALQNALSERGARIVAIAFDRHGEVRSIPHILAQSAGVAGTSIRSVESVATRPELSGVVFVIDGIAPAAFHRLALFLRSYANVFQRIGSMLAPIMVCLLPGDLARSDIAVAFGSNVLTWRGVITGLDVRNYLASVRPDLGSSFLDVTAAETLVSVAGWDTEVIDHLAKEPPESLVDPRPLLGRYRELAATLVPCWSTGLVDDLEGVPFVHSLACAAHAPYTLHRRVWQAHARTTLPFVEEAKGFFLEKYRAILESKLPYRVETKLGDKFISSVEMLEINHIRYLLDNYLSPAELSFAKALRAARNKVAHGEVVDPSLIRILSEAWKGLRHQQPEAVTVGWHWPRCGQRLVLMVGPSGAGKSTLARRRHEHEAIVSTDDIRLELYGSLTGITDQREVFRRARERAILRLSRGESVVVDATNLKQRDRLAFVDLVPPDITVIYEVVDRPLPEKIATGGWRSERKIEGGVSLVEGTDRLFQAELPLILAGDERPNVLVRDLRTTQTEMAADARTERRSA